MSALRFWPTKQWTYKISILGFQLEWFRLPKTWRWVNFASTLGTTTWGFNRIFELYMVFEISVLFRCKKMLQLFTDFTLLHGPANSDRWTGYIIARRAYCVGEVPENHVCPSVRCLSGVRVRVRPDHFWSSFWARKWRYQCDFSQKGDQKRVQRRHLVPSPRSISTKE